VHEAAREGRLRDLQAALDRRKFAIARDGSNSMGTTPLHVATLFGHTAIVRYLGGRFPETLQARDSNDRTPLHYAATIADNGHYYNLLLHLGADPALKDNVSCYNYIILLPVFTG
jgi:ankyrin repeat protein